MRKCDPDVDERAFLERASRTYSVASLQDKTMRDLSVRTFAPYICSTWDCLQLGYFEGGDTDLLHPLIMHMDVVEGCKSFIDVGRKKLYPNVTFYLDLFEDFPAAEHSEQYDAVFALYVLEHVRDVQMLLRVVRAVLKPHGLLFVVVPNARALSRQLALHMRIVSDLKALTANDHNHGHRRVYDRVSLNHDLAASEFQTIAQGGILLKILADSQLDKLLESGMLGQEHIDGLYELGLEYPDLCSALFSICRAL